MYNRPMMIRSLCKLILAASLSIGTAGMPQLRAETAPSASPQLHGDAATLRDQLFRQLKQARSEQEGRAAEDQIWLFWTRGPDEESTKQVAAILAARRAYDNEKALRIAEALVARRPDYAEGWNQKATMLFEKEDYDGSLDAIQHVLELEPKHFGALAGKAVILMRQGRMALAQEALRIAVEIHPFLKERGMLIRPAGDPI
jgi:tetratricopeptide (TPR) repeat protein